MNAKKQAGAAPVQAAALPEATKTEKPTVLHSSPFAWYEGDGVGFLCEKTMARVYAATDAIETLTALLLQREFDAEAQADGDDQPGLTMDTRTTVGLLHALATCNSAVQQMTTGPSYGMRVSDGEEARALTRAAQEAVWQQDVKRAKFVNSITGGGQ
ncbi:MAG: hypothetical protein PHW78_01870 [Macromonas bipunctata]|nr:hypothetical protein [Macromonas bipunctata]